MTEKGYYMYNFFQIEDFGRTLRKKKNFAYFLILCKYIFPFVHRYRGLKSFRTSPWDPKENLPLDYARIFQFGNYRRTRKRVMGEEETDGAWVNQRFFSFHL